MDVHTEQLREGITLGLAELWKFSRHVLHRTMSLAQLNTGHRCSLRHRTGRCCVTLVGERSGQRDRPQLRVVLVAENRLEPVDHLGRTLAGKGFYGCVPDVIAQVTQHRDGQLVILAGEPLMSGIGENERPSRPTTLARASGVLTLFDQPVIDERLEVSADAGLGQSQLVGQARRRDRPMLRDGAQHALTRAVFRLLDHFHNTIVA